MPPLKTTSLSKQKFHRYYAWVTLTEYKTCVSNDSSQFECLHCFKVYKESVVTDLKNCIEVLKAEILNYTLRGRSTTEEATEAENN